MSTYYIADVKFDGSEKPEINNWSIANYLSNGDSEMIDSLSSPSSNAALLTKNPIKINQVGFSVNASYSNKLLKCCVYLGVWDLIYGFEKLDQKKASLTDPESIEEYDFDILDGFFDDFNDSSDSVVDGYMRSYRINGILNEVSSETVDAKKGDASFHEIDLNIFHKAFEYFKRYNLNGEVYEGKLSGKKPELHNLITFYIEQFMDEELVRDDSILVRLDSFLNK